MCLILFFAPPLFFWGGGLLLLGRMMMLDRNESCYVHYVIKDSKIYGTAHGPMQGFKGLMDDMLLSLASKVETEASRETERLCACLCVCVSVCICVYLCVYLCLPAGRLRFLFHTSTLRCVQVNLPDTEFVINLGDWPLAFHTINGEKQVRSHACILSRSFSPSVCLPPPSPSPSPSCDMM